MKTLASTRPRRIVAKVLVTASLIAIPVGLAAAPASAAPRMDVGQPDCDRTGAPQWQENRGQWEMGTCDMSQGQWRMDNAQQWSWHRNDNAVPAPAPAVLPGVNSFSGFGS